MKAKILSARALQEQLDDATSRLIGSGWMHNVDFVMPPDDGELPTRAELYGALEWITEQIREIKKEDAALVHLDYATQLWADVRATLDKLERCEKYIWA